MAKNCPEAPQERPKRDLLNFRSPQGPPRVRSSGVGQEVGHQVKRRFSLKIMVFAWEGCKNRKFRNSGPCRGLKILVYLHAKFACNSWNDCKESKVSETSRGLRPGDGFQVLRTYRRALKLCEPCEARRIGKLQ